MNLDERNYYEIFDLARDADTAEIEASYQRVLALYEQGGEQSSSVDFEHIRRAYEVLRDPKRRAWYDSLLAEVSKPFELNL